MAVVAAALLGDLQSAPCRCPLVEDCSFTGTRGALTSVDILDPADGSAWRRTYSDGAQVTIEVPPDGAAVPVLFPIGG